MGKLSETKNYLSHVKLSLVLTVLGIIIAIFFGIYSIYSTYEENKSEISFEIINEVNVLDVHEDVNNLTILFQGEDIQKKNLNLRIITFRIENSGNIDILQSHYDINGIWGIQVKNGDIIRTKLTDSNSDYLNINLKPEIYNKQTIKLSKTIFEKGKYFTIELLVFHNKDESPEIISIGKIAGIDKITPVKLNLENENTFITNLFYGTFFINIVRFVLFGVSLILLLIAFLLLIIKIDKLKDKRKRKKEFESIVEQQTITFLSPDKLDLLKDVYIEFGIPFMLGLISDLNSPPRLISDIKKWERGKETFDGERIEMFFSEGILQLYLKGVIEIDGDKIIPDPDKFIEFLKDFEQKHSNRRIHANKRHFSRHH